MFSIVQKTLLLCHWRLLFQALRNTYKAHLSIMGTRTPSFLIIEGNVLYICEVWETFWFLTCILQRWWSLGPHTLKVSSNLKTRRENVKTLTSSFIELFMVFLYWTLIMHRTVHGFPSASMYQALPFIRYYLYWFSYHMKIKNWS